MVDSSEPDGRCTKRKTVMEGFIHRENLALFKKRLAEPCDDARRQVLLKLLATEEAREPLSGKDWPATAQARDTG
jgi:hypothetical protein